MKKCYHLSVALILLWIGAAIAPRTLAQEQQPATDEKSTSSVTGHVMAHSKGQSGIEVRLIRLDPLTPRAAELVVSSGEDGTYRFNDVPPSTYQVRLVSQDFFLADALGLKILVVGVGEHVKGVDFEMLPGAVVTGRVRDTEGHQLANRLVSLLVPKAQPAKEGTLMPEGELAQTDATGAYRINNAPAGRYFIGAQERLKNELTSSPSPCSEALYPGVTDPAKAIVIELAEGCRVANIDITVGRGAPLCFSVSGKIVDGESGLPLARARYGVAKVEGGRTNDFFVAFALADDNGEFKIGGLLPGQYTIVIRPDDTDKLYAEPVEFEVVNENLTGLTVTTSAGASVSGSIVIEGNSDQAVWTKLLQLRIGASTIAQDGTFHLSGLPAGNLTLSLVPRTSIKKDFVLLRTERDGVLQPRSIPLKANEQIKGLKVVVAYGTGIIRGAVKYESGTTWNPSARVGLFWPDGRREIMWSPIDLRGNFLLEGVPAGSYWLELRAYSPELRRAVSVRKQLEVADGAARNVTMTLDLRSNSPAKTGP